MAACRALAAGNFACTFLCVSALLRRGTATWLLSPSTSAGSHPRTNAGQGASKRNMFQPGVSKDVQKVVCPPTEVGNVLNSHFGNGIPVNRHQGLCNRAKVSTTHCLLDQHWLASPDDHDDVVEVIQVAGHNITKNGRWISFVLVFLGDHDPHSCPNLHVHWIPSGKPQDNTIGVGFLVFPAHMHAKALTLCFSMEHGFNIGDCVRIRRL